MGNFLAYFGPLSQFDIVTFKTCGFDPFLNAAGFSEYGVVLIMLIIITGSFLLVDFFTSKVRERVVLTFCTEKMALNVVSPKNTGFSILIEGLFGLIFMSNFLGLLPFSQTMTSQLIFTIFFSFIAMLVVWLQALFLNKIFFFSHFLPNGAPLIIAPFIILIEVVSNLSRLLSISVRLFANMTSGHALLKILSSFVFVAVIFVAGWKSFVSFPILLVFVITGLEVLIAFLQTYVFITLLLIYINEQE